MRRERHNLSMLTAFTLSALNPTNARRPERTKSSGLAQLWKSTFFFRGRNSTNCFFSNLSPHFQCMTSFTPPGPIFYLGFYFDICEWRILSARAWTPALMLHLTNPCANWKVLSLTKPIYYTIFYNFYSKDFIYFNLIDNGVIYWKIMCIADIQRDKIYS